MSNSSLSYCGELVRRHDPDRFLLSMFAPPESREALWALFAFNHEIAKTREVVSETQLGLIRLQWWREAIQKIYEQDEVLEHEVLRALAEAIKAHELPRAHFDALVYAREFDLEDVLPGNVEGFLNYADFTTTPLCKLAVQVTGDDPEMEPVQPVAVNYALAGLLRAVPSHAQQRRCYLPEDLMNTYEVRLNQLYELKPGGGLIQVVDKIVDNFVDKVRADNKFLKASQTLGRIYVRQIKRLGGDVFHPRAQIQPFLKEIRVIWGATTG